MAYNEHDEKYNSSTAKKNISGLLGSLKSIPDPDATYTATTLTSLLTRFNGLLDEYRELNAKQCNLINKLNNNVGFFDDNSPMKEPNGLIEVLMALCDCLSMQNSVLQNNQNSLENIIG